MGYFTLAKGLRFRIGEDGNIYAATSSSSGEFYVAPEVFSLLCSIGNKNSATYTPKTQESKDLIADLMAAGVLLAGDDQQKRELLTDGFGDPWIQWAMLADKVRSGTYLAALKKMISPASVVLDVGAGTGFLSAAALAFGAQKVIAIEETAVANVIKPVIDKLKLKINSKNFILQNRNSFDAKLSQDINLVVSELFGNDPFMEGVLPVLRDISARLPAKKVKFVPEKLELYFEFIHIFSHPVLHRLNEFQKVSAASISGQAEKKEKQNFYTSFLQSAFKTLDFEGISFPLSISKNDFERISASARIGGCALNPPPASTRERNGSLFCGTQSLQIDKDGENAVALFWFRVHLTDTLSLSSHPMEKDWAQHWSPIAIPLKKALRKGNKLKVKYSLNDENTLMHFDIFDSNLKIGSR